MITELIRKNNTIFKISKKILSLYRKIIYRLIFVNLKVNDKVVIFSSYSGKNYSCNPKAIYETMIKDARFKEYKFVWAFKNTNKYHVKGAINVTYGSLKYLFYLSTAKLWIFNAKMPEYYIKKRDQVYLQTWHGTPLKRLSKDINIGNDATFYRSKMTKAEMINTYKADSSRYDYFVSANKFSTDAFESAFDIPRNIIIETGYPRNDILVNFAEDYIYKIKVILQIPRDKKIILYAPTWRDNNYDTKGYIHQLKIDFSKWHKVLGDRYFIIYKPHYLIYNTSNLNINNDFMLDASEYDDINDLYLISDMLITDYSSVFFDYGVLRRPVLFYMYDLEEYKDKLRGFYLDIYKELPGPIIKEEVELLDSILKIEDIKLEYKDKYISFYNKFCILNSGKSSKQVVDILHNAIREKNI